MSETGYIATGVRGVDTLLEGKGIPRSYIVFVLGGPGSGKTTFALQFLKEGATRNENGVYVSLDEDPRLLRANARTLGMNLEELETQGKLAIVDASPLRKVPGEVKVGSTTLGRKEFLLASLIQGIKNQVKSLDAKRLVVDPLATFILQYPSESERRSAILDLMQGIAETACTTLLVSELLETGIDRAYQFEEYLAQGVLILRKMVRPGGILRVFTVEKMRGVNIDHQPHPYKIVKGGIEVYPTEIAL